MTVTVTAPTVDLLFEVPDVTGSNTPHEVTVPTVDLRFDFRPNTLALYGDGPGPMVTFIPDPIPQVDNWVVTVVDLLGGTHETLTPDATVEELRWEMNGPGGGRVTAPALSPLLHPFFDFLGDWVDGMHLAVYRGTNFVKKLVPMPRMDPKLLTLESTGMAYHLSRRYVGRNNATPNLATNGGFDTDVVGWTAVGSASGNWDSAGRVIPGSLFLYATAPGDNYFQQSVTIDSEPFETFVWVEAWAYVITTLTDAQLPGDELGIKVVASVGGVNVFIDGAQMDWKRVGTWQRVHLKVYIPANQTSALNIQLYAPQGQVRWDDVYIRREERLYATGGPEDVMAALVIHAQQTSIGKVNVGITFDGSNSSGAVAVTRAYKYSERAMILQAINELTTLNRSVNWHLEEPTLTDSILTSYPRTGFDSGNKQFLEWGLNVNSWDWVWDVNRRAQKVAYLGRGSGDLVNEAFYTEDDPDVGYERVVFATVEASVNTVDAAAGLGAILKRPRTLRLGVHRAQQGAFTFDPGELCFTGDLLPCRLVRVDIDHGLLHVHEDCMIVQTTLHPGPETADVDVIPVSAIEDAEA